MTPSLSGTAKIFIDLYKNINIFFIEKYKYRNIEKIDLYKSR
nr:MAG TPA: hypothetical protein [Caudoviricetes sp.]